MICSNCGTENETGFKFCVKCGSNMENPTEVNYEAVDRGNYHTEEEFSENSGGFTINEGTFIIRDVAPVSKKKSMYTSDELNSSEEEFDFSMYDEPTVPPKPTQQPIQQPIQQPQPVLPQGGGQPANLYMQQPVMNGQPQIAVYDQNGMPLYGQPMMYAQPQIVGYDQNGMPLYGQPMMYAQPQIVGYDQNGMPLYGQPQMQPMGGIPAQGMVQNVPQAAPQQNMQTAEKAAPQAAEPEKDEKQSFWDFFDDGSKETHSKENENDFFGKAEPEPIIPEDPFADIDNRRKKRLQEKMKANGVMSDIPVVDGDKLEKNETAKMNHIYMRKINDTMSADLKNTSGKHQEGIMAETKEVDASLLSENISIKSRISMGDTESVNADNIEKADQEHHEALMAQADRAVEALPKKINPYESELDKIELPDYMQAKKTVREKTVEIPSLPEI